MRATLVELLHLVAGLVATCALASLSAWAVPNAESAIWWTALGCAVAVVLMGIVPLREAWRADKGTVHG
jgi:hypothetical protein